MINNKYFNVKQGPRGIAYDRPEVNSQLTTFRTGDDGWHIANGTYDYTRPVYPLYSAVLNNNSLEPFKYLVHNNEFGNKNRFTDINGLQVYGDDYVIDHLTGLGWYRVIQPIANWNTQIDNADTSTQNGHSDWRLPSGNELQSIVKYQSNSVFNYSPFNLVTTIHSSTTRVGNTTQNYFIQSTGGAYTVVGKTSNLYGILVRNHYNTGDSTVILPVVKSGIVYQRPTLTSQRTSYRTGDNGYHLTNGTYDYTAPEYPVSFARLDTNNGNTYKVLVDDNEFGNKNRYTSITGTAPVTGDYVIDHLTGLAYYTTVLNTLTTWEINIDTANASTQDGFSDWRMTNLNELSSLFNFQGTLVNPFGVSGVASNRLQSSTTRRASSTTIFYVFWSTGTTAARGKAGPDTAIMVRNHYN